MLEGWGKHTVKKVLIIIPDQTANKTNGLREVYIKLRCYYLGNSRASITGDNCH